MNAENPQKLRSGPASERPTEIQSPEGLGASIDLSIPGHVAQHPDAPQVSGYILTELLGEGAYGQVWRSWQIRTRKEVAVKVFKQRTGLDWILLQREVERLMRLDRHPHVVTLLDAGLESDPPYYVIDLLDGGSLDRHVNAGSPLPVERIIAWAMEVCDALSYVHRKGIIHCDLKPANILVDDEGRVRVVDFGQSRVFNESSAALGTLFFMAPEQAIPADLGQPVQPDVRWDVYALGGTLYAILTGQAPYASTEDARSLQQAATLADRLEQYRRLVGTGTLDACDPLLVERAGPELAAVVAKCLAPKPENRYESVAELRADLLALQAGRPVSPLAHSGAYRLRKFVRRNPIGVGLIAAVLLLVFGGIAYRTLSVRLEERKARAIVARFVDDPVLAREELDRAKPRMKRLVAEGVAEGLASPAFTQRVMSARAAMWADPDAFWESVDGGPLWRHGEWLEVVDVARVDPAFVIEHLTRRAAAGSDRQRYVAFCLLGQIAGPDAALADLCANAATTASNAGVVAAACWAAGRLGKTTPPAGTSFRADDVSCLTFVEIPGCESFRRGSPPEEVDRYEDEQMAETGRPVQSFFLSTTEVTAGVMARFVEAPEIVEWLASQAKRSDELRESLALFGHALQMQLDRGASEEPVSWTSLEIAQRYCSWLTDRGTSATPPRRYRLPSEDQWEYACRAGNPGRYCFGDDAKYARYFAFCKGDKASAGVASRMPSFFGLFDMHGSLWEWTDSRYPPERVTDPKLTDEQKKNLYVIRGGAYYSPVERCRSAQRNFNDPLNPNRYAGLRIVMEESSR